MTNFIDSHTEDIVSQLAQDETGKRQYYRPVYSLHKWWARRPGALFRSIILLASGASDRLFAAAADGSPSRASGYFADHNLTNLIILDPFMGGGTTLVEANRLGAKVIGCDLNPVSYWVVRETLKPLDLEKLDHYFRQLEESAGKKIQSLYSTRCTHCQAQSDALYVFWLRYVTCPACQADVYLFKRTLLNEGESRNRPASLSNPATVFCPVCLSLNEWKGKGKCVCRSCGAQFDPRAGTYDEGLFSCPRCDKTGISLLQTLKPGNRMRARSVAIEYWCDCRQARLYKAPDPADLEKITEIEGTFEKQREQLTFPKQRILEGASSVRWRLHNYQYYYEVFSPRQLLAFNHLIDGIRAIPEEEFRNALITVFSNSLEYNNMMTPYNYPHRKLHHLFTYHAMPLTTTPVENVVWGAGEEGAGTFVNCYERYRKAKEYCEKPFDKFKDSLGQVQTIYAKREKIAATFVSSFEELKRTPRGALLLCGDSAQLENVPDQSVDLVVTDPPYFDNVHYSELANFFYVWLKCLVDGPAFASEHVPTQQEAIVNDGMAKGEGEYQALLGAVFKECQRVLKRRGKLIFTFHHVKWRAWWTVLTALRESGFRVVDALPVMSEYKVNPHIRNKQALDMDLVLVCQKKALPVESVSSAPADILGRAMAGLTAVSDHSDNKLFLHFMGELLRTAGAARNGQEMSYDCFSDALTHFDDFLSKVERPAHKGDHANPKNRQLRLPEPGGAET